MKSAFAAKVFCYSIQLHRKLSLPEIELEVSLIAGGVGLELSSLERKGEIFPEVPSNKGCGQYCFVE